MQNAEIILTQLLIYIYFIIIISLIVLFFFILVSILRLQGYPQDLSARIFPLYLSYLPSIPYFLKSFRITSSHFSDSPTLLFHTYLLDYHAIIRLFSTCYRTIQIYFLLYTFLILFKLVTSYISTLLFLSLQL